MGWKGAGSGLGRQGRGISDPIPLGRKDTVTLNSRGGLGKEGTDRQIHVAATKTHKTLESKTKAHPKTQSHTPTIQTHNDTNSLQGWPRSTRGSGSQHATQYTSSTPAYEKRSRLTTAATNPIPETNKGHQILLQMGWKGAGSGLGRDGSGICDPISLGKKDTLNLNSRSGLGHEGDRQTHVAATELKKTLEPTTQANQETRNHTPYIQTHNATQSSQGLPTSTRGRHSQQVIHYTRPTSTEKETTTHRRTVTQRTQTSAD